MNRLFSAGVLLALCGQAFAQDGIPAEILKDVKAATVYVQVKTTRGQASGSGFVMQVKGDTALIVTNEHVVVLPPEAGPRKSIEVVFNSGKAKLEKVVTAELLAADDNRDLAILRVTGVKDLPKAFDLSKKPELTETMTVYAMGFPFGKALSTTEGFPAITIGKGSISSLREDDAGELSFIQIDGDINPGNSGGPVVDAKGRLVGVAVAKLRGTNIGLAIPPRELEKMLAGRLGGVSLKNGEKQKDSELIELEFEVRFIDPMNNIKTARIVFEKGAKAPAKPEKGKPIPQLKGEKTVELKVENQVASGKVQLPEGSHLFQVIFLNESKKEIAVQPAVKMVAPAKVVATRPGTGSNPIEFKPGEVSEAKTIDDIKIRTLAISGKREPGRAPARAMMHNPCLTWTADGKGFYSLTNYNQTVRLYSFPELKELAKLDVGKVCSWISLSPAGLVVSVHESEEAWVLDAASLKKISGFAVGKTERVLTSPTSDFAYAADAEGSPTTNKLRVYEIATGKMLKEFKPKDISPEVGFKHAVISLDGKNLFAIGAQQAIVHLTLDKETIALKGSTYPRMTGNSTQVIISSDGKWVCAPAGGGNQPAQGAARSAYTTYVFAVSDLAASKITLTTGAYPRSVALDPKSGTIYGQNHDDHLIIMNDKGEKSKSYKFAPAGRGGDVHQILVHPDGKNLLMLYEQGVGEGVSICAVELPPKR